ncbi:MAG TPA: hypothetical protein VKY53_08350 [Marinobacter sp.]|nr:hypothetical protein [Marinobacter sp.]
MSARYLTPAQDASLRRWERWNRRYFIVSFLALLVMLIFSSQLGLSSGEDWGTLGVVLALAVLPIIAMQLRLRCPACREKIGWQAKLMAPDQCRSCQVFLRSRSSSA